MTGSLDCVVIGYKERPPEARRLVAAGNRPAIRDTQLQNVRYRGRYRSYLDFLSDRRLRGQEWTPENEYRRRYLTVNEMPTLAPVYLTSYLRRKGITTEMVNYFDCEKRWLEELLALDPLTVAITTTFYTDALQPSELTRWIRRRNPAVKIVMGGPLIRGRFLRNQKDSLEKLMLLLGADYYVVEEFGLKTLAGVVQALKQGSDVGGVPNVCSRDGGSFRYHGATPEKLDVSEDAIDWDVLDRAHFSSTMNLVSAQSCPYRCSFCNHPVLGGAYKVAEVEVVERQLDQLSRAGRTQNVVFVDDTFNLPKRRFKEFCRMMIRRDFGFRWFSYLRVDDIDREAAQLMRDSGCSGVCLGIESGDDTILENMNKQVTVKQYMDGMDLLNANGVWSFGNIIVGYPGETEETVRNTSRFLEEAGITFYRAGVWQADPTTPIFRKQEEFALEGAMFDWRHATMDVSAACDHLEAMFKSIKGPTWCPIEALGFWGITYLLGKGFTLNDVHAFLRIGNSMVTAELERDESEAELDTSALAAQVDTLLDRIQIA